MTTSPPRGGLDPSSVPSLTGRSDASTDGLTPQDWFVLSRVDGRASVHTIGQLVGMNDAAAADVIERLARAGHVSVPGLDVGGGSAPASRPSPAARPTPKPTARKPEFVEPKTPPSGRPASSRDGGASGTRPDFDRAESRTPVGMPRTKAKAKAKPARVGLTLELVERHWPLPFDQFTFDPAEMESGSALTDEQKQVVLYFHYHLKRVSYYDLFGVAKEASKGEIRKAYFRLSKAFHPDRWFRKDVGLFGDRIESVFKWLNRAYAVLNSPRKRKGYDRLISRGYVGEWQLEDREAAPDTAPRQSTMDSKGATAMLRIKARRAEASGAWQSAADLYFRALQIEPSPDLRIRYIECMLKADGTPSEIDRTIQKAHERDEGSVRLWILEAEVARRLGDSGRARRCYERVLEQEPSNPVARLGLDRLKTS